MPACKKCGSGQTVKSGVVAGKQRFLCKECGCNFREGDARTNETVAAKKALCILLYAVTKGSFRMMGKILDIDHASAYRWVRSFCESLPEPAASGKSAQMECERFPLEARLRRARLAARIPPRVLAARLSQGEFASPPNDNLKRALRRLFGEFARVDEKRNDKTEGAGGSGPSVPRREKTRDYTERYREI
jgi:transposase-like protein